MWINLSSWKASRNTRTPETELDRVAATWRQEIAQEYDKIRPGTPRYRAEQMAP
ncbi:MAG: hypothetical protein IPG32_13530 [Saprospirales bacterium]|nr:hypothetical protein [Saprospirales bacterium]